jgi:hypothetical protein
MADTIVERGYLDTQDDGYLEGTYLGGEIDHSIGMQVLMSVNKTTSYGMQVLMNTVGQKVNGMQINQVIAGNLQTKGMQVKADTLRHALCGVYLESPYLEDPYLVECMAAYAGMQVFMNTDNTTEYGQQVNQVINSQKVNGMQTQMVVNAEKVNGIQVQMVVNKTTSYGMQTQMIINALKTNGMQVQMIINKTTSYGMQVLMTKAVAFGMQTTLVFYNTTQLRLMCEFPSRGIPAALGLNWVASTTYTGDFSVNNLNTDIVEQVYRSGAGSASLVTITCDTGIPQGVPVDTIAILNHNLTTSATVQVQGSQDNFATPPAITFNMLVESENMYWISPDLPTTAGQNRYWRFIIQDPTNTDTFVQIGTILFGDSDIFSVAECFTQPIVRGYKHFKDAMETEGFTSESNDRALKRFLRLNFEKLNYAKGNFQMLDAMLEFARTSLKCLVIPTPEYPSRFAVFAKLVDMPELSHTDNDIDASYVDLSLEWDESK